ncbi:hypothetical protein LOTGIDRAFT_161052 [Lottia gigantea]|uniref:Uncharacterized protein n=1 Tax=Lottia gigantea TaxID=225164 RepID=V4AHX1_LOTGI|nr:hypothetical protein LOTGIDRAFT_161052 [Lottia gigantea]ESO94800.1 hypothetical protein LOTGIDRAFT_161052 [Lottia gigantea]
MVLNFHQKSLETLHCQNQQGHCEAGVKIAKSILLQDDIFQALSAYRTTPLLSTGYSPSQLTIGRNIRTELTSLPSKWPSYNDVKRKDEKKKNDCEYHYNKRHGVRPLSTLKEGDPVRLKIDTDKTWSKKGVKIEHTWLKQLMVNSEEIVDTFRRLLLLKQLPIHQYQVRELKL